jgi:hypothetical protein
MRHQRRELGLNGSVMFVVRTDQYAITGPATGFRYRHKKQHLAPEKYPDRPQNILLLRKSGDQQTGRKSIRLSAVDRDGNMVSLIQSNYDGCGSGVVGSGTGFALQNRRGLFSLERGHPNALAARKTSSAHHHSCVHAEGRQAHRFRDYGKLDPASGASPIFFECGGFRDEHSGCNGGAALYQIHP